MNKAVSMVVLFIFTTLTTQLHCCQIHINASLVVTVGNISARIVLNVKSLSTTIFTSGPHDYNIELAFMMYMYSLYFQYNIRL